MYNVLLQTDFYKATHLMQFNSKITSLTSYLTPRSSRLNTTDKMVWFGIQGFIQKYLVGEFNNNFFNLEWNTIAEQFHECLGLGLGYSTERIDNTLAKVKELYDLGYLPIRINALPEGTLVPMNVPALEISTTKDGFAWVGQAIESLLSCSIWHPCVSATVAYEYAKIAKEAYKVTVEDDIPWQTSMCDFSLRGQESNESAVASSAAWLTAFYNSSTVHARSYIKDYYGDKETNLKIGGLTSTEHSVMTSDYAITNDERETYRRLLTEVYPDVSFAAVSDSYDFWNVLTNILPSLREEIEAHQGFIGVRHDSAEPVEALCGIETIYIDGDYMDLSHDHYELELQSEIESYLNAFHPILIDKNVRFIIKNSVGIFDRIYQIVSTAHISEKYESYCTHKAIYVRETTWQDKGMVETLYELFGGTTNSKGYKVVNPKLKAVYGDSITIPRAEAIYTRLEAKGFAANNVSLGVGSFSMEAIEENGELKPFTRDTFSIAIKATYGKLEDGTEIEIYKDPKNFAGKKSLRGICVPYYGQDNKLDVAQRLNEETQFNYRTAFKPYFINGVTRCATFAWVRENVLSNLTRGE